MKIIFSNITKQYIIYYSYGDVFNEWIIFYKNPMVSKYKYNSGHTNCSTITHSLKGVRFGWCSASNGFGGGFVKIEEFN